MEDQEDWDKFAEDCDLMFLNYAKKKKMPMEQVFAQYAVKTSTTQCRSEVKDLMICQNISKKR